MKILIVGLGNPILGDDGVGWVVADQIANRLQNEQQIDVIQLSLGGLSLMEHLAGYQHVILVDSIYTGKKKTGDVYSFPLSALPDLTSGHSASAHDVTLNTALKVGREMGVPLPDDVMVIAIESPFVYDFSEELSPVVAQAVPKATQFVLDMIHTLTSEVSV